MRVAEFKLSSKPFEEMTDEEKIEWAKNHRPKPRTRNKGNNDASTKRKNLKRKVKDRIKIAKDYADPEKRKRIWGSTYAEKRKLLYQYNPDFRAMHNYQSMCNALTNNRERYDLWSKKYYANRKGKVSEVAQTFQLTGTFNYMHGMTVTELAKHLPFSKSILQTLITEGIMPEPHFTGKRYHRDKFLEEPEPFYNVLEVEAILNIFARARKRFFEFRTDTQKAYVQKLLWTELLQIREKIIT